MRAKTSEAKNADGAAAERVSLKSLQGALAPQGVGAFVSRLQRDHGNRFVQKLLRSGWIQAKLTVSEPGDQFEQEADRVAEQVMRMPDPATADGATLPREVQAPQIQRMCSACEEEIHLQPAEEGETLRAAGVPGGATNPAPVRQSADQRASVSAAPPMLQRVCGKCEEKLHRQQDPEGSAHPGEEAAPLVHDVLRSPGRSLDSGARSFFEPRFGRDFGGVQVHTDEASAES